MIVVFASFYPADRTVLATSLLALLSTFSEMLATACSGFFNTAAAIRLPSTLGRDWR
jgi:hypothetical protein